MSMEITSSYNSYAAQGMVGSGAASGTKKNETEKSKLPKKGMQAKAQ